MTTRQEFVTTDQLRLEIEVDPTGLANLVPNPDGELGGWGWVTPLDDTAMTSDSTGLRYESDAVGLQGFLTALMPVEAGQYVAAHWQSVGATPPPATTMRYRVRFVWHNSAGAVLSASAFTGYMDPTLPGPGGYQPATQAPAGTAFARLEFALYRTAAGEAINAPGASMTVTNVTVAKAAAAITLNGLSYLPPVPYLDILGPTHQVHVVREELNLGTLTAVIHDADLDPVIGETIRPGRRVRLIAKDNTDVWRPLFTGEVLNADVTYDLTQALEDHRTRIVLTAVDPLTALANVRRSEGVADVDELPYVLEDAGVPWRCNGSGDQVSTATVVSTNDNASAIDQVAVTRDTQLGYAWVDVYGVLNVYDQTFMPIIGRGEVAEDQYSTIDLGYNTEQVINDITVRALMLNPDGTTEELVLGPFEDAASVREWKRHHADFTVHGTETDWVTGSPPPNVAAVFAANGEPQPQCKSIRIPIATLDNFVPINAHTVFLDLFDTLSVYNTRAGGALQANYITRLEHTITADQRGGKWLLDVGFTFTDNVARPQVTPSPTGGANGKTLNQLLRPVGEVSLWHGAKADCPAGWLVLDGASFSGTDYPELEDLLGGTTLPNFTDRFPIGAGTKALGATGGSVTHAHPLSDNAYAQMHASANVVGARTQAGKPTYTESTRVNGTAGSASNTTTGTPLRGNTDSTDSTPPYRALWFIIRAR